MDAQDAVQDVAKDALQDIYALHRTSYMTLSKVHDAPLTDARDTTSPQLLPLFFLATAARLLLAACLLLLAPLFFFFSASTATAWSTRFPAALASFASLRWRSHASFRGMRAAKPPAATYSSKGMR